jgi:hypothetical protein
MATAVAQPSPDAPRGLACGMDPTPRHEGSDPRGRRTVGKVADLAPVQIALGLLVVFLGLLVLWVLWPLIGGQ